MLASLETWDHEVMEPPIRALIGELNLNARQLLGSIRAAISGRPNTPPLFTTMEVLGRERTMRRIDEAIERLA